MPVGVYEKDEIRKIAEQIGLPVAKKKDSQEICFVPDKDYAGFIEENTEHKFLGIFGEEKVNVLKCNIEIAEKMGVTLDE